jgi:tetratricopeptide (TPR) repeat protein
MSDLQLDTLESKGLIRLATIDPELEYLFRHALVQDAAYESLLKQERRVLHRQVGEALEQLYPERHGELAAMLARHFEQADEKDKAIEYLLEAARFASERNALVEAYDLFGRAEALLPMPADDDPEDRRRRRLEIRFGRVKTGFSFLSEREQIEMLGPLVVEAESLGDLRLEADIRLQAAMMRMFQGEHPEASADLERSLARVSQIAGELHDPVVDALPKSVVGLFQVFTGELRQGVAALQAAAPLLEQKKDFIGSSFALMALGVGLARLGRFEEAERAAERAISVGEEGDVIARIDAMIGRSIIRSIQGDFDAAIPLSRECTQLAQESGATACVVASSFVTGDALMRQSRFADAQIVFEQSNAITDLTNERMFRPMVSAYLRSAAAGLGNFAIAGRTFEEALDEARAVHDRWGVANIIFQRAETEARKPDPDAEQMLADYRAAVEAFTDMGARPYLARSLRAWAGALRRLGRSDEGTARLREALALFDELGLRSEADEVRAELAKA